MIKKFKSPRELELEVVGRDQDEMRLHVREVFFDEFFDYGYEIVVEEFTPHHSGRGWKAVFRAREATT